MLEHVYSSWSCATASCCISKNQTHATCRTNQTSYPPHTFLHHTYLHVQITLPKCTAPLLTISTISWVKHPVRSSTPRIPTLRPTIHHPLLTILPITHPGVSLIRGAYLHHYTLQESSTYGARGIHQLNPPQNHTSDHPSRESTRMPPLGFEPAISTRERLRRSPAEIAGSNSTSYYMTFFTVLPNGLTTHSLHTTRIPNLWRAGHIHHRHPKPYYYCRSPIQGSLTSTVTATPMKLKNE